jgi:Bifunctional DNA primase/polymerase, N-terminal
MSATAPTCPLELTHARPLALQFGLAIVPMHREVAPGACSCRSSAGCGTPGKHPRIRWADRPAEPPTAEELEHWWAVWPDSRVGIILGDRLCAFDVDEHGEEHGLDALRDLEATFGVLPDTWRALSPSGGVHVYFRLAGEVTPTTHALRPGVQLRAGRHIMACPPSDGREWEISPAQAALASLPAWVPQLVRENEPTSRRYLPLSERLRPNWRHDSYVAAARSMARAGFPVDAIEAALTVTDRQLGDPPKNDPAELRSIAEWATNAQAAEEDPT